MMQQLRWMPLSDYFKYRTIILVFKVLHGLTPDYLDVFKYVHEISSRSTRLRHNILKDLLLFMVHIYGTIYQNF